MKKLFCTVVTAFDGNLDTPTIYHVRTETKEQAENFVLEELEEMGWDEASEVFDLFTFEVRELDIVEV